MFDIECSIGVHVKKKVLKYFCDIHLSFVSVRRTCKNIVGYETLYIDNNQRCSVEDQMALSLYKVYGIMATALLVLNGASLNSVNVLLVLSQRYVLCA